MALTPSRARGARTAVAALGALGALAGCGGPAKPSQQALAAKLRGETELQTFNTAQIDCVAKYVRQYGDARSLEQYVQGRITADQLQGSDESTFQQHLDACLKS
jgi:hypothetical protein